MGVCLLMNVFTLTHSCSSYFIPIYSKQCSLFCFISFCFVFSCWDLPNQGLWCCALDIFRKLSMSRVALIGLRLFGATVWKPLIIESFSQWKLNIIEIENCIEIWAHSWCFWKALSESDVIEFISQFSEVRCGRYWFLSGVHCWKFKQIAKIGFGRKISGAFNVFTLPMAQATLVYLWSKVVCFVCHVDISQIKVLHVVCSWYLQKPLDE